MVGIWREIFKTEMEEDRIVLVTQSLGITEVIQILENPPDTYITTPPVKPKAGQVYLFKAEDAAKQGSYIILDRPYIL